MSLLLPACQTTRSARVFPTPDDHWKTSVGQLQYVTPQRSVIGGAVVSREGAREFQLDFVAGPGVPLMKLRESGDSARAEGLFARGSWEGAPSRAGRLASWMALREVFAAAGQRGHASFHPPAGAVPAWTAQTEPRRISVEFQKTGERFVFVFGK